MNRFKICIYAIIVVTLLTLGIRVYATAQWQEFIEEYWDDRECYILPNIDDTIERYVDYRYSSGSTNSTTGFIGRLGPFKFGHPVDVDIDPSRYGKWFKMIQNDGYVLVWKFRIKSPGAVSLNIACDKFILPENSELYITGPDRNGRLGPFKQDRSMTKFSMLPMPGDYLDIEYISFIQDQMPYDIKMTNLQDCRITDIMDEFNYDTKEAMSEFKNANMDERLQLHICRIVQGFEDNITDGIHNPMNSNRNTMRLSHDQENNGMVRLAGLYDTEQTKQSRPRDRNNHDRSSGACHINSPTCAEALPWQKQSSSVALMMIPDCDGYCTGCLLNNPLEDGRQLFLTAYHCVESGIHENKRKEKKTMDTNDNNPCIHDYILTVFNHQASECHGELGSDDSAFSQSSTNSSNKSNRCKLMMKNAVRGLKVLVWNETADIALCEILGEIPESLNVYMSGFSVDDEKMPRYCVGFHHPAGDVKKMCIRNIPIERCCWDSVECASGNRYHWLIQNWTFGATEIGSSGSPLFNHKGLVIGELRGGESSCIVRSGYDIYGSLSSAYHDFGFSKYLNPTKIENLKFVNGRYLNDIKQRLGTLSRS